MTIKRTLCLLLAILPVLGWTDDAVLSELLTRIRQTGQAQFQYEETRVLELADAPWHGQGVMLSGTDGSLVKLQLQPARVIMAIAEQHMLYWDPQQNQRHSAALDSAGPAGEQIKVFRSILQGRTEDLQLNYAIAADKQGPQWTLRLTPKPELSGDDLPSIELSGDDQDQQRRILIKQPDGESTEYRMHKATAAQIQDYSLPSLLREASGE
ncbi:outer membrane lipoprotein carrier protein LolA [Methylomonas sp. OY6]|uniref:Outer membrane lipoprotein carrier protein LolA n=1 Tax=Methylomonas defluvii TaxID=3045149 RepID=A0ABU4UKX0_9GAMM|nr:outer membrane lipoprotein carrier protein LolA [Methylomonas sp. OY6]MDX8130148.1 outer membrane lipoprotein carrier protein LolA [Methylomonas sp. OY6]